MTSPLPPDIFEPSCRSHDLLGHLADKWTILIVIYLGLGGRERFGRLQKEVGGLSAKTLTRSLRHLEQSGFVTRDVTPTVPVTVEYALTKQGQKLARIFGPLRPFIQDHVDVALEAEKLQDVTKSSKRTKSSSPAAPSMTRRRANRKGN